MNPSSVLLFIRRFECPWAKIQVEPRSMKTRNFVTKPYTKILTGSESTWRGSANSPKNQQFGIENEE